MFPQWQPAQRWISLTCLFIGPMAFAQSPTALASDDPARRAQVQQLLNEAMGRVFERFAGKKLQTNQLAVTLVDLRDSARPVQASYRGHVQVYPASVVKLFYLVAVHRWMADGRIQETDEVRRAMRYYGRNDPALKDSVTRCKAATVKICG